MVQSIFWNISVNILQKQKTILILKDWKQDLSLRNLVSRFF